MDQREEDLGTLTTMVERFQNRRHPEAVRIKERLDGGEELGDEDVEFLHQCLEEIQSVMAIIERNPDYHHLASQVIGFFGDLTSRALGAERDPRR